MHKLFRNYLSTATPAQRCILAIGLNTPFIIAFVIAQSVGMFVPQWAHMLNHDAMSFWAVFQLTICVIQWGIAWSLWPRRHDPRPLPHYFRAIAMLAGSAFVMEAILLGSYTYPTGMVIICIIPIGLMLFDLQAIVWAFFTGIALLLINEVLTFNGVLLYAPGYKPAAFVDGEQVFIAEILRTFILYTHYISYGVIFWLLFDQYEHHRRLLRDASRLDALTGLSNRRYFMERLEKACREQKKSQMPLSLVLVDADHFKRINDAYGHHVGDEVLQGIAEALNVSVRNKNDLLARVGGEEFAILLPATELSEAQVVCERVRNRLQEITFGTEDSAFYVTLSFGIVTSAQANAEGLLHEADLLLYRAKSEGRNRMVAAQKEFDYSPGDVVEVERVDSTAIV